PARGARWSPDTGTECWRCARPPRGRGRRERGARLRVAREGADGKLRSGRCLDVNRVWSIIGLSHPERSEGAIPQRGPLYSASAPVIDTRRAAATTRTAPPAAPPPA